LTGGYFNYINHFVGLKTLLIGNYWGYGFSEVGRFDELNLSVGILQLVFAFLGLVFFYIVGKKKEFKITFFLISLAFIGIFMIHPRSGFIWQNISLLRFFQFPWRFLIIVSLFLSIVGGSIIRLSDNKKLQKYIIISITSLLLVFYASFFKPREWLNISDEDKFSGNSWSLQQTVSILDYLPISAKSAPRDMAPEEPIFDGEVLTKELGTNWQRWILSTESQTQVILPVYYFPNWRVEVDGQNTPVFSNDGLGLISFNMEGGVHEIYAKLNDTPIRNLSNLLTAGSLLVIPIYKRRKK
jgi:hypothetical protein